MHCSWRTTLISTSSSKYTSPSLASRRGPTTSCCLHPRNVGVRRSRQATSHTVLTWTMKQPLRTPAHGKSKRKRNCRTSRQVVLDSLLGVVLKTHQNTKQLKEPNKFHIYETEKITRKASDAAEDIHSCSVLSPEIVMHDASNVIL